MKKFLKWFFIVVIILLAIHFINSFISAKVCFDIYTAMKEKVESEETFYAKQSGKSDETYAIEQEIFIKDNTFVKTLTRTNVENNEKVQLKFWQKYLPNKTDTEDGTGYVFTESGDVKGGSKFEYDPTAVEPTNKMYRYGLLRSVIIGTGLKGTFFPENEMMEAKEYTYLKMLGSVLKNPTLVYSTTYNNEKCYAIRQFYIFDMGNFLFEIDENPNMFVMFFKALFANHTVYVSKDTKMPVGTNVGINGLPSTCEYFTKEVTDEDIKLPNVEEYTLQENN